MFETQILLKISVVHLWECLGIQIQSFHAISVHSNTTKQTETTSSMRQPK